jgi:hypothetical protein
MGRPPLHAGVNQYPVVYPRKGKQIREAKRQVLVGYNILVKIKAPFSANNSRKLFHSDASR